MGGSIYGSIWSIAERGLKKRSRAIEECVSDGISEADQISEAGQSYVWSVAQIGSQKRSRAIEECVGLSWDF